MRRLLLAATPTALACAVGGTPHPHFAAACYTLDAKQILVPIQRPEPEYPRHSPPRMTEGYAVLRIALGPDGAVTRAEVVESQPPGFFDRVALAAVRQWRYCPPGEVRAPYPDPMDVRIAFKAEK